MLQLPSRGYGQKAKGSHLKVKLRLRGSDVDDYLNDSIQKVESLHICIKICFVMHFTCPYCKRLPTLFICRPFGMF